MNRLILEWLNSDTYLAPMRPNSTDKIETDRLRAALSEIVPAEKLANWLLEPNPAFEGQTPIQIIERGEADRIWRMIHQIEDSVAS